MQPVCIPAGPTGRHTVWSYWSAAALCRLYKTHESGSGAQTVWGRRAVPRSAQASPRGEDTCYRRSEWTKRKRSVCFDTELWVFSFMRLFAAIKSSGVNTVDVGGLGKRVRKWRKHLLNRILHSNFDGKKTKIYLTFMAKTHKSTWFKEAEI